MNRLFVVLVCVFIAPDVFATVYTPDPSGSISTAWDQILGSGSFEMVSLVCRGLADASFCSSVDGPIWDFTPHGPIPKSNLKISSTIP